MTNHPNRSKKTVLAWHFLAEPILPHGDGRKVEVGKKLTVEGSIELCSRGLHGSVRLIDALGYASGSLLCRVRHSGTIIHGDDKLVSSERTVLWMGDVSTLLHEFACDEAEMALEARRKAGDTIDPRSTNAIKVKRLWLKGKATDAELDAAWADASAAASDAASAAARDAASAAARDAAWSAASAAASAAARDAAWSAASDAAWSAARDAASAAARDAQNKRLTVRVMKLMRKDKKAKS